MATPEPTASAVMAGLRALAAADQKARTDRLLPEFEVVE